jgi:hypothetical protein
MFPITNAVITILIKEPELSITDENPKFAG